MKSQGTGSLSQCPEGHEDEIEYTDLIRLTVNNVRMQRCDGRSWKLEMGFTAVLLIREVLLLQYRQLVDGIVKSTQVHSFQLLSDQ